jgi:mRNA interferase HicA
MKRGTLLRHLRKHGCYLKREGSSHSLWCNPQTGHVEAVPRHIEIPNLPLERSSGIYLFPIFNDFKFERSYF